MKFEVVESGGEWIVRDDGQEAARFASQDEALSDVARRLRAAQDGQGASLTVRYAAKT